MPAPFGPISVSHSPGSTVGADVRRRPACRRASTETRVERDRASREAPARAQDDREERARRRTPSRRRSAARPATSPCGRARRRGRGSRRRRGARAADDQPVARARAASRIACGTMIPTKPIRPLTATAAAVPIVANTTTTSRGRGQRPDRVRGDRGPPRDQLVLGPLPADPATVAARRRRLSGPGRRHRSQRDVSAELPMVP